jgi:phosphatidate cytidylyltransferase
VNNILEGLIWFWVPASLVICNDVFAYIWGKTTGRTPLIKLSPNKTVEGFVGAFWSTIVFGIIWGTYFMRFDYMICPVHDLGVSAWSSTQCTPNPVFIWRGWQIWKPLAMFLSAMVGCFRSAKVFIDYPFIVFPSNHNHPLCTLPTTSPLHVVLRLSSSALRRVFCVRVQTCI